MELGPAVTFLIGDNGTGMGRPDELVAAVRYLLSHDARFVTGTSLVLDGGYTAVGAGAFEESSNAMGRTRPGSERPG